MKPFLIACALLLTGCATYIQKRNINRLDGYSVRYPAEMARLSNQLYPCFNGKAKSDTVIKFGKPDTTYLKGDTTLIIRHDTVFKTIRLQGKTIIIPKYTTIHDTIADNRALASCTIQLRIKADSVVTLKANLSDKEKSLNVWRWIAIGLISVLGVYTAIKGYLLVSGGGVVNTAGDILKKL